MKRFLAVLIGVAAMLIPAAMYAQTAQAAGKLPVTVHGRNIIVAVYSPRHAEESIREA